jgi:hypothetical protein
MFLAAKSVEDRKLRSREKEGYHSFCVAIAIFVSLAFPQGILRDSDWIGNNRRTKNHLMRQHAKIARIHLFSKHSNICLNFRISTVFDHQSTRDEFVFLRIFGVPDAP